MVACISIAGYEVGERVGREERFIDNKRIEGTIPEMLDGVISFLMKNMSVKTIVSGVTAKREDKTEYPIKALREGLLNALIHRDYSIHTEGAYIQVRMFKDRVEIQNPGGLFGRVRIEMIGKEKSLEVRNPNIIRMLEELEIVENRGSGIPTMIDEMESRGLSAPTFESKNGDFLVSFYADKDITRQDNPQDNPQDETKRKIIGFCHIARSRKEIADYLGMKDVRHREFMQYSR